MTKLMTKQEIKDQAQLNLLNDGDGAFLFSMENNIQPMEDAIKNEAPWADKNALTNEKAIYAEMEKQFDRMKKFFGWESFQGNR